jgi:OOP family OmpA-OmpF porin
MRLAPIEVAAIEPDAKINLNNIFFDFNKAVLKPDSYAELNRMVELMKERATMTVMISGHTDSTGPDTFNLTLSKWRANAVTKYLTEKGIDAARITTTYFGETRPIESNATKEGRRKNRRVEFKIIKL